ncbi:multidrug efflux SMR transporter [Actinomycetaceae bacterium WB03_NA08]|uniref:Multidrug efflux SMR transporter n=1 Tax=Scrofimicrobium canadense TaxID=2652290 RepID=A0A6N7VUP1_9ACTO|nr:multidrug efflux SMR transporter [Scrofimicrobium canadense]MSS84700.1 multidrug efflux SMR transporter [Scrofimicrobium canadense]
MPWLVLIFSALCEAVWATALGDSHGLTEIVPTIIFFVALVISMLGLAWAVREIPIGTAYAVWTGLGAALTVSYAVISGAEVLTLWRGVFLAGIVMAVVGLKLAPTPATESQSPSE